jgi:hypothetical protein
VTIVISEFYSIALLSTYTGYIQTHLTVNVHQQMIDEAHSALVTGIIGLF